MDEMDARVDKIFEKVERIEATNLTKEDKAEILQVINDLKIEMVSIRTDVLVFLSKFSDRVDDHYVRKDVNERAMESVERDFGELKLVTKENGENTKNLKYRQDKIIISASAAIATLALFHDKLAKILRDVF